MATSGTGPAVVELFTSQGCSSCPPADALMARLARERGILVLTRPVTYWDRLGWRDTLAREANTQLQRHYAAYGGEGSGVYTPQAVVNGLAAAIGSDERAIRNLLAQAHAPVARIAVARQPGMEQSVVVEGEADSAADVKAISLRGPVNVRIGSGENSGSMVTYTNVVNDERIIGRWRGGTVRFAVPTWPASPAGSAHVVVIVQKSGGGQILGAQIVR